MFHHDLPRVCLVAAQHALVQLDLFFQVEVQWSHRCLFKLYSTIQRERNMYIVGSFVSVWAALALNVVGRVQMGPLCLLMLDEVIIPFILFCLHPTVFVLLTELFLFCFESR